MQENNHTRIYTGRVLLKEKRKNMEEETRQGQRQDQAKQGEKARQAKTRPNKTSQDQTRPLQDVFKTS
jgi:hypothetical protein